MRAVVRIMVWSFFLFLSHTVAFRIDKLKSPRRKNVWCFNGQRSFNGRDAPIGRAPNLRFRGGEFEFWSSLSFISSIQSCVEHLLSVALINPCFIDTN